MQPRSPRRSSTRRGSGSTRAAPRCSGLTSALAASTPSPCASPPTASTGCSRTTRCPYASCATSDWAWWTACRGCSSPLRPLDPLLDQALRVLGVAPADHLDPFAGLEVLVVLEEVLDLPNR